MDFMTPKTKKHYDRILELLEKNQRISEYGTISAVYAVMTDDASLIHDFGAEYEQECGRNLASEEAVSRLRYILSLLEREGKVVKGKFCSCAGWINVYDLPGSMYVKFHKF